jgi:hypothetical protein
MAGTKPFRLLSFDYGEVIGGHSTFNASTLIVIGNVSGGGTLTRTFQLDSNTDGPGGAADFQAATLDAPFSDTLLASVDFYGSSSAVTSGAFSLDNLVTNVTPVPEPGMLSLIGIGLLVFPIARRKPATRQS